MQVGERVLELRKQARWSLRQLEQESGVNKSTINRIERGKAGYDFRTHQRLAQAFDLTLPQFYEGIDPQSDKTRPLQATSAGAEASVYIYNEQATATILVPQILDKKMLPQLITLQPGGKTHVEQNRPGSDKCLLVIEGVIEVRVGEERFELKRYGTLYFKASQPHQLSNSGKHVARCFSVTSPVEL